MSASLVRHGRLQLNARHSVLPFLFSCTTIPALPSGKAMMSAVRSSEAHMQSPVLVETPPTVVPVATSLSSDAASPQIAARPPPSPKAERPRPQIRSRGVALKIAPEAVRRLKNLSSGPTPQLIRIGTRNKGCAGMSYHLEYVEKPDKFDEVVEQDGVRVLIDSKALFSIIGSEMDWSDDKLSSRFTFRNPNIKDACGCGESFNVG